MRRDNVIRFARSSESRPDSIKMNLDTLSVVDFARDVKGDIYTLIQYKMNLDFRESFYYLKQYVSDDEFKMPTKKLFGGFFNFLFPRVEPFVFGFDNHRHSHIGILLFEGDNVGVKQADAAFGCASRHRFFIVGAAVDADATMARCGEAQKPIAVGFDAASAIFKIVMPRRGILYLADSERFSFRRFGRFHIAFTLLVAFVFAQAGGKFLQ